MKRILFLILIMNLLPFCINLQGNIGGLYAQENSGNENENENEEEEEEEEEENDDDDENKEPGDGLEGKEDGEERTDSEGNTYTWNDGIDAWIMDVEVTIVADATGVPVLPIGFVIDWGSPMQTIIGKFDGEVRDDYTWDAQNKWWEIREATIFAPINDNYFFYNGRIIWFERDNDPEPETPKDEPVDCAGVKNGTAYMASCGCIGGTTGKTSCPPSNEPKNYTAEDAKKALKAVKDKYGKDIAKIVEKMTRFETAHFKSKQFRLTGTGGMEAAKNSSPPYYGWHVQFFKDNPQYTPVGTTGLKEGKGLSEVGGNPQEKYEKTFVIMPSVEAALMLKADYIERHNGNYANWLSNDPDRQQAYRNSLVGVNTPIVNSFE